MPLSFFNTYFITVSIIHVQIALFEIHITLIYYINMIFHLSCRWALKKAIINVDFSEKNVCSGKCQKVKQILVMCLLHVCDELVGKQNDKPYADYLKNKPIACSRLRSACVQDSDQHLKQPVLTYEGRKSWVMFWFLHSTIPCTAVMSWSLQLEPSILTALSAWAS